MLCLQSALVHTTYVGNKNTCLRKPQSQGRNPYPACNMRQGLHELVSPPFNAQNRSKHNAGCDIALNKQQRLHGQAHSNTPTCKMTRGNRQWKPLCGIRETSASAKTCSIQEQAEYLTNLAPDLSIHILSQTCDMHVRTHTAFFPACMHGSIREHSLQQRSTCKFTR